MEVRFNPTKAIFTLLVDPEMVPTKRDFVMAEKNSYRYFLLGGNHSYLAERKLTNIYPQRVLYRNLNSHILVGLDSSQMARVAFADNLDNEFRHKLTLPARIRFIHHRYEESSKPYNEQKKDFKRRMANEVQLKGWGVRPEDDVLESNDNMFQLAYREGHCWELIQEILIMYDMSKLKGQAQSSKKSKKEAADDDDDEKPPQHDMKITEWKAMQGLPDDMCIGVLCLVVEKKFSLAEMGQEFGRLKIFKLIMEAYCVKLGLSTWDEVVQEYGEQRVNNETLRNHYNLFKDWKREKPSSFGKRVHKKKSAMAVEYPEQFDLHIETVLRKKEMSKTEEGRKLLECAERAANEYMHSEHGSLYWDVARGDVRDLSTFLPTRNYTLAIIDIVTTVGEADVAEGDTRRPFGKSDIERVITEFKKVTTSNGCCLRGATRGVPWWC